MISSGRESTWNPGGAAPKKIRVDMRSTWAGCDEGCHIKYRALGYIWILFVSYFIFSITTYPLYVFFHLHPCPCPCNHHTVQINKLLKIQLRTSMFYAVIIPEIIRCAVFYLLVTYLWWTWGMPWCASLISLQTSTCPRCWQCCQQMPSAVGLFRSCLSFRASAHLRTHPSGDVLHCMTD